MARILWINPLGSDVYDAPIHAELAAVKRPDTEIEVRSLAGVPDNLEYHLYEAVIVPKLLEAIVQGERDGFDAACIGCFFDTGLDAAREVASRMAVAAPCESALKLATSLGASFSIVLGQRKWVPHVEEKVERYGLSRRLRSCPTVDLHVADFGSDKATTFERVSVACREAVERDQAEVCVLGCTIEFGIYRRLQEAVGVPVVDAVVAPLKYAEMLADVAQLGWTSSRAGLYGQPPRDAMEAFGLSERFSTT